ncbi:MAG: EamA family transporter [Ilumatobacter fluminis]|uniref:EamA family transporter n=1 Tax=Ilumatobacter fluminis TaxID=467091 RepID=UPI0032ED463F
MWILITLAAATFQILRTSRQHQLRSVLSTAAAGFVRYAYGAPLALLLSLVLFGVLDRDLPGVPASFWPALLVGAVGQIAGTVALLQSFKVRDFAVGTVYSKSEVLFVAALGAIGFETALRPAGWFGAVLVTIGVAWLASKGSLASLLERAGDPAALLGLAAGAGFAAASLGIGSASRSLTDAPSFDRAALTLTALLVVQTLLNAGWFVATDPSQIARTIGAWRPAIPVGVLSLLGSIGWAWAFTLESAAKVRTLGQVELIIAFVLARLTLGERHTRADYLASGLVLLGVVLVTVWG